MERAKQAAQYVRERNDERRERAVERRELKAEAKAERERDGRLLAFPCKIDGVRGEARLYPDRVEWDRRKGTGMVQTKALGGVTARKKLGHTELTLHVGKQTQTLEVAHDVADGARSAILAAMTEAQDERVTVRQGESLADLAALHKAGALTDEEFAAAKAKKLGL